MAVPARIPDQWVTPAVMIAVATVLFSCGVWVGRTELSVQIATLSERVDSHTMQDTHPGGIPRVELMIQIEAIHANQDHVSDQLEKMDALIRSLHRRDIGPSE